jgi:drug/metabolite transporter (DMT)-like permease
MASVIERSPKLGYALTIVAAVLFGISGSLARFLLDDGLSAWRLTEVRSVVTFVLLGGWLLVTNRALVRVDRGDVPLLAFLGIFGLAAVQSTYFAAIARLDIGVALTIQYLAPGLILVVGKLFYGWRTPPATWAAVALAVGGAFLVVKAYDAQGLDGLGLLAAAASCVTFAINLTSTERAGRRLDSRTTLLWGMGFCSLLFLIVQPLWTFPWSFFSDLEHVLLGLGVAILGTLIPFVMIFTALRHVPAAIVGVIMTFEPVIASLVAWPVHDQVLAAPQIGGIVIVVAAVAWVQAQQAVGSPPHG